MLLKPGRYAIDTNLRLGTSGVVLRGSGDGAEDTVLVATGTSRRTLIEMGGHGERVEIDASRVAVTDEFVPVGATRVPLTNAAGYSVGDRVVVRRPCTAEWIKLLEMDVFPGWRADGRLHWRPGSREIVWERIVAAIDGDSLTLDAPLTTLLDPAFGGGTATKYEFPGRINHVGLENLRVLSAHLPAVPDQEHAWVCAALDKVEDAWVRQLTARHFVGYVVYALPERARPARLHHRLCRRRTERVSALPGARRTGLERPGRKLGIGCALRQRDHPRQRAAPAQSRCRRAGRGMGGSEFAAVELRGNRHPGAESTRRGQSSLWHARRCDR